MSTELFPLSALQGLPEAKLVEPSPIPIAHVAVPEPAPVRIPAAFSPGHHDFNPAAAEVRAVLDIQIFERSRIAESQRPRQWNLEARAASDFLAHAMEYLADSRELPTGRFTLLMERSAESEAILILMEAKRQIAQALPFVERRRKGLFASWTGIERRKDRQD